MAEGKKEGALPVLILCTVPDGETAEKIAKALLERRLAACVSRGEKTGSSYWWNGAIETASEYTLTAKTVRANYEKAEALIRSLHPYDVPEIIALPVLSGYRPYLDWLESEACPDKAGAPD